MFKARPSKNQILEGYPFDQQLLALSPLYRRSRSLYLHSGGTFRPTLASAARMLSSSILLEPVIEYTPLDQELEWALTDKIERKNKARLAELRRYASSVFHEQNHRILWQRLAPIPRQSGAVRRYLHFAESLVITLDMALADELGPKRAGFYQHCGLLYDPGTDLKRRPLPRRLYRNYLQACLHATYLNLEHYDRKLIAKVIRALYSNAEPLVDRAIKRSGNLNRAFITQTNLAWQQKNQKKAIKALARVGQNPLELRDDPTDNIQQYVFAEQWFTQFGL